MCRWGWSRYEPPERLPPHTGHLQPLQNARTLEAPGAAPSARCEARTGEALDEWLYHGGRGRSRHAVGAPLASGVRVSLGESVEVCAVIILDDPVTGGPETPDQRAKTFAWFERCFNERMDGAVMIIVPPLYRIRDDKETL